MAVGFAIGGLVLPWLRGPERLPRAYAEAAEELGRGTRTELGPGDFLWVSPAEVGASFREPLSGAWVWSLCSAMLAGGAGGDDAVRHGAELLARPDCFSGGAYALALCPVVVLVLAYLGARGLRGNPWVWICGFVLIGIYGLGRWRVAATAAARAAAEIEMGPGPWLTMLAALVAGLLFLARWYFPKVKWL